MRSNMIMWIRARSIIAWRFDQCEKRGVSFNFNTYGPIRPLVAKLLEEFPTIGLKSQRFDALARDPRPDAEKVEELFLLAIARKPTPEQLRTALDHITRAGERAARAAERLEARERNHAIHRQMLDAASRRRPDRDALAERLRDGRF